MMKWGYKTVHFALKKEGLLGSGFLDESEVEQELNEYGHGGWELVSVLEVVDGIIVFFKQPLSISESRPVSGNDAVAGRAEPHPEPAAPRPREPEPEPASAAAVNPENADPGADPTLEAVEPEISESPESGPVEQPDGKPDDLGAIRIE